MQVTPKLFFRCLGKSQDHPARGTTRNALRIADPPFEVQRLGAGQLCNAEPHIALGHEQRNRFLRFLPQLTQYGLGQPLQVKTSIPDMNQAGYRGAEPEALRLSERNQEALLFERVDQAVQRRA
ncbi:hypothetical protein D9M68_940650 [compost metagenome]